MADSVDKAFEDLMTLKMCLKRIHWFSSGIPGKEMRMDGDRCTRLNHWSLVDYSKCTIAAVHSACRAKRIDAIVELKEHVDLNQTDETGWTVLHTAMLHSDAAVRTLMGLGVADKKTKDGVFASLLNPNRWKRATGEEVIDTDDWIVPGTMEECVEALVDSISSTALYGRIVNAVNVYGSSVLDTVVNHRSVVHVYCRLNKYSACRVCLELGGDVDQADSWGDTPLHHAGLNDDIECARLVLQHGASVDKTDNCGQTPLHHACLNDDIEYARLLLQYGADVVKTDNDGWTPLHYACFRDNIEYVRLLLEHGADVDKANNQDETPLHHACSRDNIEYVRLLLEHGADVDKANKCGDTPLHVACFHDNIEYVRLLLEHGANVDNAKNNGWTPLHYACVNASIECARLLLQYGAAVDKADNEDEIPLHHACLNNSVELARLLLQHGADVDKANILDWTPLHGVCLNNSVGCACLLLEHGASVNVRTHDDQSPAAIARVRGHYNLADALDLCVSDRAAGMARLLEAH